MRARRRRRSCEREEAPSYDEGFELAVELRDDVVIIREVSATGVRPLEGLVGTRPASAFFELRAMDPLTVLDTDR